ncbi:MAG: OmpA family protein [Rhizobiaceae bacterium]|nr:OmpA family protein [Rhizobiaceae bacterium]
MFTRRTMIAGLAAALMSPVAAHAAGPAFVIAQDMPSAGQILRQLEAAPRVRVRPEHRMTIHQLMRRPDIREMAPAIDIQSINFAFGSAVIPESQYGKVENIAEALRRMNRRGRSTTILIEGHTDAVGSTYSNQRLSERRAESLKQVLVYHFGIPSRMLQTVGYGEEYLLVPTPYEEWRNRRVTLRRVDEFLR